MMASASLQQLEGRVAADLDQMRTYVSALKDFGSRQALLFPAVTFNIYTYI